MKRVDLDCIYMIQLLEKFINTLELSVIFHMRVLLLYNCNKYLHIITVKLIVVVIYYFWTFAFQRLATYKTLIGSMTRPLYQGRTLSLFSRA